MNIIVSRILIIAQTAMSALCFIPAIILQWFYFGLQHKKRVGTFQAVAEAETTAEKKEENPNLRPKLFWVNLIIFVIPLVALGRGSYRTLCLQPVTGCQLHADQLIHIHRMRADGDGGTALLQDGSAHPDRDQCSGRADSSDLWGVAAVVLRNTAR